MLLYAISALFSLVLNFSALGHIHKTTIQNGITPTPTIQAIETQTPLPTREPVKITSLSTASSILSQINNYRNSLGIVSLSENTRVCSFAQTRALEITSDFSHKGFEDRVGNHTLPYPSYHFVGENIAETSNPNQVFTLWKNSPGHDANMRSSATFGCIGQNGNFFALELWNK